MEVRTPAGCPFPTGAGMVQLKLSPPPVIQQFRPRGRVSSGALVQNLYLILRPARANVVPKRSIKMKAMKLALPLFVALAFTSAQGLATPILGSDLATFAVLGATPNVTNTGATTLTGDVGVSPALSITGLATVTVDGTNGAAAGNPNVHLGDATAGSAQTQLGIARTSLGLLGAGTLLPVDLVGLTIFPGVFTVPAGTTNLSGALTLDGLGNASAFWLFQMPSSLITSTGAVVNVINTGAGAGVFWNVGSDATLNSGTTFAGNILALTSITMGDAVTIGCGRALANTGTVTMIGDTINAVDCAGTGAVGSNGLSGSGLDFIAGNVFLAGTDTVASVAGNFVPEPSPLALLGIGLVGLFTVRKSLLPVA